MTEPTTYFTNTDETPCYWTALSTASPQPDDCSNLFPDNLASRDNIALIPPHAFHQRLQPLFNLLHPISFCHRHPPTTLPPRDQVHHQKTLSAFSTTGGAFHFQNATNPNTTTTTPAIVPEIAPAPGMPTPASSHVTNKGATRAPPAEQLRPTARGTPLHLRALPTLPRPMIHISVSPTLLGEHTENKSFSDFLNGFRSHSISPCSPSHSRILLFLMQPFH